MSRNGADILVESLIAWGVDTIFGLPGDGINGVMEAIRTRQDRVRFVQVRHEESSALMRRGVTHLAIPIDVQEEPESAVKPSSRNTAGHTSFTPARDVRTPTPGDIDKAADLLNAAQRVAILAGQGARGAVSQLLRTA